jgi:hypothetical protein
LRFVLIFTPSLLSFAIDFIERRKKLLVVRQFIYVIDVHMADYAFFIDNERSAFREALITQDAVRLGHLPMRPIVTQERKVFYVQRFCPRRVGRGIVYADAQHLGICRLEPIPISVQVRHFFTSDWRERGWVKREDHILTAIVTEAVVTAGVILQSEIGCRITDLQRRVVDLRAVTAAAKEREQQQRRANQ